MNPSSVKRRRLFKWIGGSVAALALLAGIGMAAMIGPRNVIGMLRYDTRRAGALRPGMPAPDVELLALDGAARVKLLAQRHDRPLVLVFGSFT